MLSIVDPPAPAPGEFMLVFSIDSATYTKLYPHGGNATEPAYVVSSAGEATHVVLRSGAGTEIGRFKYPGIVGRGRRNLALATAAGDQVRRVDQWLDLPKPGGREDQPAGLKIDGKEYKWTDDIQEGDREIYRLACGDETVASFVPSRNSTPAVRRGDISVDNTAPESPDLKPTTTRAHVVFLYALAVPEATAVRDEALLSLLAMRQSGKLTPRIDRTTNVFSGGI